MRAHHHSTSSNAVLLWRSNTNLLVIAACLFVCACLCLCVRVRPRAARAHWHAQFFTRRVSCQHELATGAHGEIFFRRPDFKAPSRHMIACCRARASTASCALAAQSAQSAASWRSSAREHSNLHALARPAGNRKRANGIACNRITLFSLPAPPFQLARCSCA